MPSRKANRMLTNVRSPLTQYAVAILIVGAAAVLTFALWTIAAFAPASFFLIAVCISAWFGGMGPGLTATGASFAAIAGLFFLLGDVRDLSAVEVLRIFSLLPVALLMGLLYAGKARAQRDLRERDARLQLVSEQIPGGLWSTDADLRVTSGFGAQAALLHGPAGSTLFDHFKTDDGRFEPIAAHRRALRGDSSTYELQWCGRTFQCHVEPLRDVHGNTIGVIGVGTDITDRKHADHERERLVAALETQHARLNAIVEAIPAAIIVAGAPDGRLVLQNSRVDEVLGHPLNASFGADLYRQLHAHHPDGRRLADHEHPLARGLRGETVRNAEYVYRRGDGTQGWIRVSGAPIADSHGTLVGSVAIFYDVDQIKRAEEEIRLAKQQLEAANQAKDRFLAVLSHELRTPLSPVLALSSALVDRPSLPVELREDLEIIRRNVELEATLIDDLLDVTRIARGKLQLTPRDVDAHDLLANAIEICRPDAQARAIRIETDFAAGEHFVRGDSARLQQVFWNLIKNAIKFTPAGGSVYVHTRTPATGRLQVEVIDTGIGIAADNLPRIFDAFEQGAPSITRQFGGLGLGLAISKALVDAHHGRIGVQSDGPGRGARFTVELQSVRPAALAPVDDTGPSGAADGRHLKILLVEDHRDTAHVMQKLLRSSGHNVETAATVAAALDLLGHETVDLVISDLGLPDGSGLDLMRDIARLYHIKGIALSGFGTDEDIQRSQAAGFAAHLTKPVPIATLRQVIAQVATAT